MLTKNMDYVDFLKTAKTIFGAIYFLHYLLYCYANLVFRLIVPPPMKSLEGEIFLITGAASGIGKEVALHIAKTQPRTVLVLWDLNQERNLQTVREAKALGADRVWAYEVNVADRVAVKTAAEKVTKEVGHVSILFNNAGIGKPCRFFDYPEEELETTIQVNMISHFWTLRAFLPHMIRANRGHIVTAGSMASYVGHQSCVPYYASKFGIRGYLESLRDEMDNMSVPTDGVVWTTSYPYFTETPMTAAISVTLGNNSTFMTPSYVARKIVEAVRQNREKVVIPPHYEIIILLKELIPYRALIKLRGMIMTSKLREGE